MKPTRVLLTAASSLLASNLMAGEAVFYVTEDGNAMRDIAVSVNGQKQLVNSAGFATFDIPAGAHQVELSQFGEWLGEFNFDTASSEENAEVQVDIVGGEAMPEVKVYLPGQVDAMAVGQIAGALMSDETGGPVSGARIAIEGTDQAVMTDDNGEFAFELPRGEYALTIAHPNYGKRDVSGLRVMSGVTTGVNMTMSLSGNGVIEEVVAVGSYIPSTATAQERDSSAVLDSIGSEQMARFGDSSAASALKRVAGVSLVGGQFAVVRGLQGRYISSTLNGGLMPSTDPMRRDVPLDLFPSSVLGGINIQKSFTPDMPGDTTGGVIMMTTKDLPDGPTSKLSATIGMNSRTTFSDVNGYEGGSTDYLGLDDGTRELPSIVDSATNSGQDSLNYCNFSGCVTPAEGASLGQSFDHIYNVDQIQAKPEKAISYSFGDVKDSGFGFYGAMQYKDKWEARHDGRTDDLGVTGTYERSKRKVDTTGYFVAGYEDEAMLVTSKTMLLRKSDNTTRTSSEYDSNNDQQTDQATLQWVERQFLAQHFAGEHYFGEHELDWRMNYGQTKRDEPDRRTYSYINGVLIPSTIERRFSELTEDSLEIGGDYTFDTMISGETGLTLKAGAMISTKERTVEVARIGIDKPSSSTLDMTQSIESIVNDDSFSAGNLLIQTRTAATDSYEATDDIFAFYGSAGIDLTSVQLLAGARMESSEQVLSYPNSTTLDNNLKSDEILPMASANFIVSEDMQVRIGVSQTLSRPGITERSQSVQYDPETDEQIFGNPNLQVSKISNLDLRAEYYFSEEENLSFAVFSKDITDPIERSIPDGSGSAADGSTFRNEDSASVQGLEIDFRKMIVDSDYWSSFISGNISWVDAEVNLSEDTARFEGKDSRRLQGQSEYLANLQFGFDHLSTGQNLTLLVNYAGDRIFKASRSLSPEMEEGRVVVDLVYQYEANDNLTVKAKAGNITDAVTRYTRDDTEIERYFEGTDISASVEYLF
ncbi:MAG: TonB-dependent receptor [Thalassobium sp.]|uniref:TonB-dependent receptor n=3 Tax=root TaxID=1 RepID=M5DQ75_9GAMM|nr:MAG: TonB-dependent receptor [Oceanospirillales bacterium]PHQ87500.1 MAG: TonB-dependent receptor [Thalassobium sp.]CCU71332.1 TonB-dependent receptor [Thalassolituus oleivorans MIL-1]